MRSTTSADIDESFERRGDAARTPAGLEEILQAVHRSLVGMLTAVGGQPRRLRLHAGEVAIELEWYSPAPASRDSSRFPATSTSQVADRESALQYVYAPTVGVFHHAPEPGSPPFVDIGDTVEPGQKVGIVEAMKLMIPVEAACAGRVVEICNPDGALVEYGEPLLVVDPFAASVAPPRT